MMPGMIMLWHGTVATIPSGWHLCDGTVGTPNLRNRFIVAAEKDDAGVAKAKVYGYYYQTGGSETHTHGFTGDGHVHEIPQQAGCPGAGPEPCIYTANTGSSPAVGTTDSTAVVPPFYALCYIMKL